MSKYELLVVVVVAQILRSRNVHPLRKAAFLLFEQIATSVGFPFICEFRTARIPKPCTTINLLRQQANAIPNCVFGINCSEIHSIQFYYRKSYPPN